MTQTLVTIVVIMLFVGICIWDLYLDLDGVKGNTISERFRAWGKTWPPLRLIVALAMGVLLGHWYW